jgi:hypothetical protein
MSKLVGPPQPQQRLAPSDAAAGAHLLDCRGRTFEFADLKRQRLTELRSGAWTATSVVVSMLDNLRSGTAASQHWELDRLVNFFTTSSSERSRAVTNVLYHFKAKWRCACDCIHWINASFEYTLCC